MLWLVRASLGAAFLIGAVRLNAQEVALVGGTLADGTGRAPIENAVVIVRHDRIAAIGKRGSVAVAAEARVIDVTGKFLIPGLMDANIHLISGLDAEFLVRYEGRYEEVIQQAAEVALKAGLTTVFDSYGPRQALVNVRERINAGRITASRLFLAGNIVGIDSPVSGDFMHGTGGDLSAAFRARMDSAFVEGMGSDLAWQTPERVRLSVREYLQRDIDFLKFLVSGHRDKKVIMFSPAVQKAMVEEAHAAGKTIQTHTTSAESLRMAIDQRVDLMQHCDVTVGAPIPEATLRDLARSQIACATLPYTERRIRDWHVAKFPHAEWTRLTQIKDENDRALIRVGANVVLSTDAFLRDSDTSTKAQYTNSGFYGGPDDPLLIGEGHFNWLMAMQEKGMKPMVMLRAATIRIAKAYRVDKDLGTVEPGKVADLVVLDRNPLESAQNYRGIHLVMKSGRVVDRGTLPTRKVLATP